MRTLNASDFKARCLSVLDEVARTGESVLILKRGVPVARVVGAVEVDAAWPQETLRVTVELLGDVIDPVASVES